jgi:hypothetical protein
MSERDNVDFFEDLLHMALENTIVRSLIKLMIEVCFFLKTMKYKCICEIEEYIFLYQYLNNHITNANSL